MYGIFLSTGDGATFWCDDILIKTEDGRFCIFSDEYKALEYIEAHDLKDTKDDQYTIEELKVLV